MHIAYSGSPTRSNDIIIIKFTTIMGLFIVRVSMHHIVAVVVVACACGGYREYLIYLILIVLIVLIVVTVYHIQHLLRSRITTAQLVIDSHEYLHVPPLKVLVVATLIDLA